MRNNSRRWRSAILLITLSECAVGQGQPARSVATRYTDAAKPPFHDALNVLDFGAFNDYRSHLLSSMFPSMAAAQVVYPEATSLSEEANVAAIQRALNSTDQIWGGSVYLPSGGYVVNSSIWLRHPHVHVYGGGQTETQLITNSTDFNVIELQESYLQLDDFWINQYGVASDKKYWAIHDATSGGAYDLDISRVEIAGGHSGIYSTGGRTIFFRCKITGIAPRNGVGMMFDGNSEVHDIISPYMENAAAKNANAGIYIAKGADYSLIDAQLQKMGTPLMVRPGPGDVVASVKASGSYFDSSSASGILLDGSASHASIVNVTLDSPWISSDRIGLEMRGAVTGLTVSNIEALGNSGAGVDASEATFITGLTITGGKISGNGGSGILVGSGLSRFTISGVTVGPSGQFGSNKVGISIASGNGDYFSIVGNNLAGNVDGGLVNASSGTHVNIAANLDDGKTGVVVH